MYENYIQKLCKEASQKLNVLARVFNYMAPDKRRTIGEAFIKSQKSYCMSGLVRKR